LGEEDFRAHLVEGSRPDPRNLLRFAYPAIGSRWFLRLIALNCAFLRLFQIFIFFPGAENNVERRVRPSHLAWRKRVPAKCVFAKRTQLGNGILSMWDWAKPDIGVFKNEPKRTRIGHFRTQIRRFWTGKGREMKGNREHTGQERGHAEA